MKYSLRFKFFAVVSGLILFNILLTWLLNNLLLEKYYFYIKQKTLNKDYKYIDSVYKGDPEEITSFLEELQHNQGIRIVIQDTSYNTKYDSGPRGVDSKSKPGSRAVAGNRNTSNSLLRQKAESISPGETVIENRRDNWLNSNFIILFSRLNNGDFISMSTPVAAIEESVNITNDFFLFTGFITIAVGSILVVLIARKFTNPILELNEIAQKMSTMDFSRRYTVKTSDEIGQLGNSINSLSEQLQSSILELKDANEKLRQDIERERKIDEMRKEFVSNVSHELKTPIALIQGYAEGLKLNVNKDEENKNFYCEIIIDEALKMNKLVKQLLELAQLEAGRLQLEKSDFDIVQLIEKVLNKNDMIFKEKDIHVYFEGREEILVRADYDRIEQVLVNYISNAVNYVDMERNIRVRVEKYDQKARVYVYNSGSHIPSECLGEIWTSFYKVDKARTRAYGGTGLGLSIVRAVQEAHHNCCGVENVEGGVEFWFDVDLA
ncbi:MAG: histidine kinase dimerization/phospho-acceptor domain-containing protein [Clostridiales bacterium]|jgi:signal transduction histidine kinase|nr:cell wall metabolism sensor histidine kinase WalK [Eubacteriales bacterium]MDH7565883.1 histidine kinase dimerization/phospho-acceptor domain-containing protein [Clostridiales bacterium]